ncbi:cytochrome P450 [Streptomyces sp. NPDC021354]|uniref:cytochrome P450 family protein n=1 Tax=Streptomyces sp. NPDC021354 TaxID=3154793 RepID=UPI0033CDF05D
MTPAGDAETPGEPDRCPFAINAAELTADPYGGFGRIREEAPVALARVADGRNAWVITRYEDVVSVLTDERFVSNSRSIPGCTTDHHAESLRWLGLSKDLVPHLAEAITQLDPPHHTRLRTLVARAFSARRVADLKPRIRALTDELVDGLPGRAVDGTVDLMEHFAHRLPIAVICELIGVPAEDRAMWREWSHGYTDALSLSRVLSESTAYLRALVERRGAEPAGDLITALIQVRSEDSGRLSDTELVTMLFHLVVAGHETTAGLIGNGVLALLTHPDQRALLRSRPELLPGAVQELLRRCSPIVFGKPRYATEDVVVAGAPIGKGEVVLPVQGAANHDPRRFPDPERLDITRSSGGGGAQHVAYSRGPHYCLGAMLANQEAELALETLFGRFPELTLAVPEKELTWRPVPGTRQLGRLPVKLGAEA